MKYQLLVSQEARLDIFDAFLWYENQVDNLGFDYEASLEEGFQRITKSPLIRVFGVFHTSRDPDKWKGRFQ